MHRHSKKTRPHSPESLLATLQTLRQAPDGAALLQQVEHGYRTQTAFIAAVERTFLGFTQALLDRYAQRPGLDLTARLKTKLLAHYAATSAAQERDNAAERTFADTEELERQLAAVLWAASEAVLCQAAAEPPREASVENSAHWRDEIQPRAREMLQQLDDAMVRSADNAVRLKIIAETLAHASQGADIEETLDILDTAIRELLDDSQMLDDQLQQTRYHANDIAFSANMAGSPIYPGAADRDQLLQRLDAEAKRAERHQLPLSLAFLGPDHLLDIENLIGPNASDEVIRRYLENLSSCARKYDVVAPCHPYSLVWLLPGAEIEHGLRALRKAQERIADAQYQYGGRLRALPTFSGAIVGYTRGETPTIFLARAEALAARARNAGPNRIEAESRAVTA